LGASLRAWRRAIARRRSKIAVRMPVRKEGFADKVTSSR
jgi:hypothetical protein